MSFTKHTPYYVVPKTYVDDITIKLGTNKNIYAPSANSYLEELDNQAWISRSPYRWLYEPLPTTHLPVSKLSTDPSFYAWLEILHTMNFKFEFVPKIDTFHLGYNAEAVKEAIKYYRALSFADTHSHATNVYKFSCEYYRKMTPMDLITVEELNLPFLFIALSLQKKKGSLILKVQHLFSELSMDILYLLSSCYEKVAILKPTCCDETSPQKYIICKGFLSSLPFSAFYHKIYNESSIRRILARDIPLQFYSKVEEIAYVMTKSQLEAIHTILQEKTDVKTKETNLCIEWCIRYQVPYNEC